MKTKINLCQNIRKVLNFTFLLTIFIFILTTIFSCEKNDSTSDDPNDSLAYSLSDLGGTWQRHSIVTSTTNSGFWIHGTIVNTEASSTVHLILPNSTMDTTITGSNTTIIKEGVITNPSDPYSHSFLSFDKKLIIGTTKLNNLYTLVLDQKVVTGTSYNSSDLQGTWQTHNLVAGGDWTGWVRAVSIMDNTGSCISNTLVKSDGETGITSGGTTLISSDGIVTVNEVPTYNGFMSADKKLIASNMTDGGGGGSFSIAQKVVSGTTYSNSDLEGKWQLHDILVGSENWTEHGIMTIDANNDAIISNMIRDDGETFQNPGTIALQITTDGIITFGVDFHGYMSADKKLIIGTRGDAVDAYSLIVLQKMP